MRDLMRGEITNLLQQGDLPKFLMHCRPPPAFKRRLLQQTYRLGPRRFIKRRYVAGRFLFFSRLIGPSPNFLKRKIRMVVAQNALHPAVQNNFGVLDMLQHLQHRPLIGTRPLFCFCCRQLTNPINIIQWRLLQLMQRLHRVELLHPIDRRVVDKAVDT